MESLSFPSCNKLLVFLLYVSSMFIKSSSSTNLVTKSSIINVDKTKPASTRAQFMASHNAARQVVGVPPLVWDTGLTTFARVYANQRRKDCSLIHSPGYVYMSLYIYQTLEKNFNGRKWFRYAYGENIFWGKGRRWSATDVVASWVAEKQWYHYNNNSCSGPDCTHYTQIVWRTTERVGCAKIVCDSGDTFAICEYYPPGNYIGARPYAQPEQKPWEKQDVSVKYVNQMQLHSLYTMYSVHNLHIEFGIKQQIQSFQSFHIELVLPTNQNE